MQVQRSYSGFELALDTDHATLRHAGQVVRSWPIVSVGSLSTSAARVLAEERSDRLLVVERAAPAALAVLRDAEISHVTRAGAWFLVDPPAVMVVRPPDRASEPRAPSAERPLAKGAGRIARWMLLHPDAGALTVSELARETKVSEATSSRAVRQLADHLLLEVSGSDEDSRRRLVRASDRAGLLDAISAQGSWRRARRVSWDIGARDVDDALHRIRAAAAQTGRPYAIGELAGAAHVERLAEPATVTLWLASEDLATWQDALLAQPAPPAAGRLSARIAPDPVLLDWAETIDGLRVADLVQLYVDCDAAGERAIDTTEMLRRRILQR